MWQHFTIIKVLTAHCYSWEFSSINKTTTHHQCCLIKSVAFIFLKKMALVKAIALSKRFYPLRSSSDAIRQKQSKKTARLVISSWISKTVLFKNVIESTSTCRIVNVTAAFRPFEARNLLYTSQRFHTIKVHWDLMRRYNRKQKAT